MIFELVGAICDIELIAITTSIQELQRLRRFYGQGRWRKLKGTASIRLAGGTMRLAEIHWYEAHGLGKLEMKIKRFLD